MFTLMTVGIISCADSSVRITFLRFGQATIRVRSAHPTPADVCLHRGKTARGTPQFARPVQAGFMRTSHEALDRDRRLPSPSTLRRRAFLGRATREWGLTLLLHLQHRRPRSRIPPRTIHPRQNPFLLENPDPQERFRTHRGREIGARHENQ